MDGYYQSFRFFIFETDFYFSFDAEISLQMKVDENELNNNFLDCDWFKKLLFSTNSLAKLILDCSISQSHSKL